MDLIVYLLNVVTTWTKFCEHHPNFKEAIVNILIEHQHLKIENEKLRKELKNENNS